MSLGDVKSRSGDLMLLNHRNSSEILKLKFIFLKNIYNNRLSRELKEIKW